MMHYNIFEWDAISIEAHLFLIEKFQFQENLIN